MTISRVLAGAAALATTTILSIAPAHAQGQWPVGTVNAHGNWLVSRVDAGCYLLRPSDNFANTISLASSSVPQIAMDSILITDPRLAPFASQDLVSDATLTLNGKPVPLFGAIVNSFAGPDSQPAPMVVVMFDPLHSKTIAGKAVAVTITAKGLTMTGTLDPTTNAVAGWRSCTAEMRGG